jgi:alpha-ketoglutarate-dependent taurine dioxygenase
MDTNASAKYLGYAPLNGQQLSELVALEADLGVVILGLKPSVPIANLTPEQISRLQQLEQQHGIIALACQK